MPHNLQNEVLYAGCGLDSESRSSAPESVEAERQNLIRDWPTLLQKQLQYSSIQMAKGFPPIADEIVVRVPSMDGMDPEAAEDVQDILRGLPDANDKATEEEMLKAGTNLHNESVYLEACATSGDPEIMYPFPMYYLWNTSKIRTVDYSYKGEDVDFTLLKECQHTPPSLMAVQMYKLFRALGDKAPRGPAGVASVCDLSTETFLTLVTLDFAFAFFFTGKVSYAMNTMEMTKECPHEITEPAKIGGWMEGSVFSGPMEFNENQTRCKYIVADDDETCHFSMDPPPAGARLITSHEEWMRFKYVQ